MSRIIDTEEMKRPIVRLKVETDRVVAIREKQTANNTFLKISSWEKFLRRYLIRKLPVILATDLTKKM